MEQKQKEQLVHYLQKFVKLANDFFEEGDTKLQSYWKGQVMGLCKAIDVLDTEKEIDTEYYLKSML